MSTVYKAVLAIFLLFIIGTQQNLLADVSYDFVYPNRGSLLAAGWDFMAQTASGLQRNTEQTTGAVVSYDQTAHPGVLRIPADTGDLTSNQNDTRNTLFHNLPSDWTSITLKLSFAPTQNYQQAGLLLYQDDDNYIKIVRIYNQENGGSLVKFAYESDSYRLIDKVYQEAAVSNLYLRLSRNQSTSSTITADYSIGGSVWKNFDGIIPNLKNPRLAILVGTSPSGFPNADLAWVHITTGPPPVTNLSLFPRNIVFKTTAGSSSSIPSSKTINILSRGLNDFAWNATPDTSWISVSPSSGPHAPGIINVAAVNTSSLPPGVYSSSVTVSAGMAANSSQQLVVNLIVNPNAPVSVSVWKDGHKGAWSASTDDSESSCYSTELTNNSKGTFYLIGTDFASPAPPENVLFKTVYDQGMELGSHTVDHICIPLGPLTLQNQELIPNINAICGIIGALPQPPLCPQVTGLAWPCAVSDVYEQDKASEYFLYSRGATDKLEDQSPLNFQDLGGFYTDVPAYPGSDLNSVVDAAEQQEKWAIILFHASCNDDGAIHYSTTKDIWGAPVGTVVKYILQRDSFVLDSYQDTGSKTTFSFHRLPIPSSAVRDFESPSASVFGPNDVITLKVDIDDLRSVSSVRIGGVDIPSSQYFIKPINGNKFLFINTLIDPNPKTVEVSFTVGCSYSLDKTSQSFSRGGGTGSIKVTSSTSTCGWTAVSKATWITITSGSSGTGTATVTYTVSRNNTGRSRTGTITVAGKTFTVTQSR